MTADSSSPSDPDEEGFELPPEPETWRTGTAIDEFTPIYLSLARATKLHGPLSPGEVDGLDLTVVAALLGVGGIDGGDFASASADLIRRRMAAAASGDDFTWE